MLIAAELVSDLGAELLESPFWDERTLRVVFVDIPTGSLFSFDPIADAVGVRRFDQPIGAVAPRRRGGFVLAARDGIAVAGAESDDLSFIADVESNVQYNLMNDAKCDPFGRLWAGTVHADERPGAGSLYRIDADHRWRRMLGGTTISNGLGWSPDGSTMYFIDSPTRRIDAFDYDGATGAITNRRLFAEVGDAADVVPDGMTVDADGGVWVALWGGGEIRRFSPSGGFDAIVRVPVAQVTSCAFGGAALDELYITTAAVGLDEAARRQQPGAGGLFHCRPGAVGTAAAPYDG